MTLCQNCAVSPIEIIREGGAEPGERSKKYAQQIVYIYNKKQTVNRWKM